MLVTVALVGKVEVACHDVIDVVPVGYGRVPTGLAVSMRSVMAPTGVRGGALRQVSGANQQRVVVDAIAMDVMQVPVVQVVAMAFVLDGLMAAVLAVGMAMAFVHLMRAGVHCPS